VSEEKAVVEAEKMFEVRFPNAIKVVLGMDNLNPHNIASVYEKLPPVKADGGKEIFSPVYLSISSGKYRVLILNTANPLDCCRGGVTQE